MVYGKDIVEKKAEDTIGGNFYKRISSDLQSEFPDMKGFSERNIFYMRSMFLLFSPLETELPQLVAVDKELPQPVAVNVKETVCLIPWGHIRHIIDKHLSSEEIYQQGQLLLQCS